MKIILTLLLLLALPLVNAIEFRVEAGNTAYVFPLDKEAQISFTIEKDFLDNIEDLKYTISLTGPATFADGSRQVTEEMAVFEEDIEGNHTVKLEHTDSLRGEQVIVELSGTYVSNSIVLGGKKTFNASTVFSVVSRDEGAQEGPSSAELNEAVSELQRENSELKARLAEAETKLESKSHALNSLIFWIAIMILLVGLATFGYFYITKKLRHKKKFKEEDY